jgi:hypothetical protein
VISRSNHAAKPVTQLKIQITRHPEDGTDSGQIVLEGEAWCYTFSPAA